MKNLTGIITGVLIIVFIGFSICQHCCGTEEACAAEENIEEVVLEENTEEVTEENTEEAEATDSTNTDTSAVVEESTEE